MELFLKVPMHVSQAVGFYVDGKEVSMTQADKLVYCYMRQRNAFFRSINKEHYETQATIAEAVGVTRVTGIKSLKLFVDNGIIEGHKTKLNNIGKERWIYTYVHDLDTYKDVRQPVIKPSIKNDDALGEDDKWAIPF